jgi:hypothetical protein
MIKWVIEQLIAIIEPITSMRKDQRELADSALRAISEALEATFLYYREVESGGERNLGTEAELSKCWSAAAIPIRHVDRNLAMICESKSEYWLNPDSWADSEIVENGIRLEDVRERYRSLLR